MFPLFNSPADTPSTGGVEDTKETIELLNEEDTEEALDLTKLPTDKGEEEVEEEEKDEKEDEVDELKELEEELEGPKEEDLELMTPVRRREILAKYPKLFKDFPYLEKAYYREQQFTEVFPTIQDARESAEKANILDQVEREVLSGDITSVLNATKQENPEAFMKIADNYLPTLKRVDQQAYFHVLSGVIKDTIVTMVREGRALGDQGAPLEAAANVLNQFIFGSQNFTPHRPLSNARPEDEQRQHRIQQEDQQRILGQFENVRDDLQTRADNVLKSTIDQHLDPKGSMTDYVKTHARQEAFETLETLISKDMRFRGLLDKLWEKAFQSGFNKESTDKIKSAYLSKAKTLLPSVIKKARNDALRGLGRRAVEEEEVELAPKGPSSNTGRSTPPSSGRIRKASDIPLGMSTLDVLMKD